MYFVMVAIDVCLVLSQRRYVVEYKPINSTS